LLRGLGANVTVNIVIFLENARKRVKKWEKSVGIGEFG